MILERMPSAVLFVERLRTRNISCIYSKHVCAFWKNDLRDGFGSCYTGHHHLVPGAVHHFRGTAGSGHRDRDAGRGWKETAVPCGTSLEMVVRAVGRRSSRVRRLPISFSVFEVHIYTSFGYKPADQKLNPKPSPLPPPKEVK